jgi:hypothetical protein
MNNHESTPKYEACGMQFAYEPTNSVTRLNWFNIANQARKRMTEHAHNTDRWRGERRTFYSALRKMGVDEVQFMD